MNSPLSKIAAILKVEVKMASVGNFSAKSSVYCSPWRTLDKSISKPGTFPEIRLVSPSYAGTTPKLVKAAKFSLPSYYI